MFEHDVFIAYAGPDLEFAQRLHAALNDHCEAIFRDRASMRGAEQWPIELLDALRGSRVVVVLFSHHTPKAWYQLDEVARACSRDQRDRPGRHVLPVRLEAGVELPYGLGSLQAVNWADGLERVVARVLALVAPGARGPCPFVVGPPVERDEQFFGRDRETKVLLTAVDRGSPVQILGERRMGKTSLLRWVERHLPAGRPAVFLDAKDARIGDAWGFLELVLERLGQPRLAAGWRQQGLEPAQAVGELPPCTLLVDEADGLVGELPGASLDFWVQFRVHSQGQRKVQWISAARETLLRRTASESFRGSKFLNDAAVVWAGALDNRAVEDMVQALPAESRSWVVQLSGGQPMVVQALGAALWDGGEPGEAVEDRVLARLGDIVFGSWWAHRSQPERAVLQRMVRGEVLDRRARRVARGLVDLGLVREGEDGPEVRGGLWRAWLEEM